MRDGGDDDEDDGGGVDDDGRDDDAAGATATTATTDTREALRHDASHELKTPLTIVRGHLELLDSDPQEREAALGLVMYELDRMGRIVQDLLLLAKHGRPDFLSVGTVELEELTEAVYAKATALAPRKWKLEERATGVIVADRQRLTQALVQLAQNAVRHSNEGGAITLGSRIADGEARFWVSDHGPGIPVEDQEAIFERFWRGNVRRSKGAGLGLAIVKAVSEAHHGRVELESRPGTGATFALVIPIHGSGDLGTEAR